MGLQHWSPLVDTISENEISFVHITDPRFDIPDRWIILGTLRYLVQKDAYFINLKEHFWLSADAVVMRAITDEAKSILKAIRDGIISLELQDDKS